MPTYNVKFYAVDPATIFSTTAGATYEYTGPGTPTGTATIYDTGTGSAGDVFSDDDAGEGTTTADVTVDGNTSTGSTADAEVLWTVRDTVTGDVFQVVSFDVEAGDANGDYLLSEMPLVPGRTYETVSYDSFPGNNAGDDVFTYADYVESDGIVSGTAGNDTIDSTYTGDPENDLIDDVPNPTALNLSWVNDMGGDEADLIGANAAVDVGGIEVTVTIVDDGLAGGGASGLQEASVEANDPQYVGSGPFDANSALFLDGGGNTDSSTTTIDFAAATGSGFEDAVQNASFRLNDVDVAGWTDIVRIRAYDAQGNEIDPALGGIVLTADGDDTVGTGADSNQVTGTGSGTDDHDQIGGSVLVEIAGPVSRIEIDYDNATTANQWLWVTDIHFEAVPEGSYDDIVEAGAGDDTIDAGLGADTIYGEDGDDTITVGGGDTAYGDFASGPGTGSDTFIIDGAQLTGETITVDGGEAADGSDVDRLNLNGLQVPGSIVFTNRDDDAGGQSGSVTLLDGTVVNFTGIERIVCFTRGTRISTEAGEVAIEDLAVGQMIETLDHGLQPLRWIGSRKVAGLGSLAPVTIRAGALDNQRDLQVSQQHRMLIRSAHAELYFGENEVFAAAKHLTGREGIFVDPGGEVEYFHMMFDTHQIVFAEGAPSESFHPGEVGVGALAEDAREEILTLFPELAEDLGNYGPTARMCLKRYEAQVPMN